MIGERRDVNSFIFLFIIIFKVFINFLGMYKINFMFLFVVLQLNIYYIGLYIINCMLLVYIGELVYVLVILSF